MIWTCNKCGLRREAGFMERPWKGHKCRKPVKTDKKISTLEDFMHGK